MPLLLAVLLAGAAPGASTAASPATPPSENVRCRRIEETGSLVRTHKECHTAREWDEISRNAQTEFGRLQGVGFSKGGGN